MSKWWLKRIWFYHALSFLTMWLIFRGIGTFSILQELHLTTLGRIIIFPSISLLNLGSTVLFYRRLRNKHWYNKNKLPALSVCVKWVLVDAPYVNPDKQFWVVSHVSNQVIMSTHADIKQNTRWIWIQVRICGLRALSHLKLFG